MRFVQNTAWPHDEVLFLIRLREQGCSYSEIARQLNRSEHSVSSKVRILLKDGTLKPHPKSYRPKVVAAPVQEVPRAGKHTLPPLPSLQETK